MTVGSGSMINGIIAYANFQALGKAGALNVNVPKPGPKPREGSPNGFQKPTAVCVADITLGIADSAVHVPPVARDGAHMARHIQNIARHFRHSTRAIRDIARHGFLITRGIPSINGPGFFIKRGAKSANVGQIMPGRGHLMPGGGHRMGVFHARNVTPHASGSGAGGVPPLVRSNQGFSEASSVSAPGTLRLAACFTLL